MRVRISMSFLGEVKDAGSEAGPTCVVDLADQVGTEGLGLALADGKALLAWAQQSIVQRQLRTREGRERRCPHCGNPRRRKDRHGIRLRSLFGKAGAQVRRWQPCECATSAAKESPERRGRELWVCAELQYVQSRLAAMLPYARCVELLTLLMPSGTAEAVSTVRARCLQVGKRLDAEGLEISDRDKAHLACQPAPCSVGLDGGDVRHCHPEQADNRYRSIGVPDFEVVAGRVLGGNQRRFAFVRSVDPAADRRVRAAPVGSGRASIEAFHG